MPQPIKPIRLYDNPKEFDRAKQTSPEAIAAYIVKYAAKSNLCAQDYLDLFNARAERKTSANR